MTYQFLSYSKLPILKEEIDKKIDASTASSIKTVAFNKEIGVIKFYNVETVTDGVEPILEINTSDINSGSANVIESLINATEGNLVSIAANGTVSDSGIKAEDVATKEFVAQTTAGQITKKIVTQEELDALTGDTADPNKIYLVKDDTVEGEDKYREYILIEGTITCIGSTSVSLEGLASEENLNSAITRISALETKIGDGFTEVTEEQIRAIWNPSTDPGTEEVTE